MLHSSLSVGIYLASVAANYAVVEALRRGPAGEAIAASFIELLALSIIFGVALEMGVCSRVQWALLASRAQGGANPTAEGRRPGLAAIGRWCLRLLRQELNRITLAFSCCVGAALLALTLLGSRAGGAALGVVAALAVVAVVRKLGCALLEGAGDFAGSRLFQALPIVLLAVHLLLAMAAVVPRPETATLTLMALLAYSATAALFLIVRLARVRLELPEPSVLARHSPTSALRWHVLAMAGALQQQAFFLVAPLFNLSSYTVFFFYGQKASQVLGEVMHQVVKERVAKGAWRLTRSTWRPLMAKVGALGLIPGLGALVAMALAQDLTSAAMLAAALFFINESILASTTLLGHIALYNGAAAPVLMHLSNSVSQLGLTILLTALLGVTGYPMALMLSGLAFSYRANYLLYRTSRETND